MPSSRCAEFSLLVLTLLEKYEIDGGIRKPLLKVGPEGNIYFYHGLEIISLDRRDIKLFCQRNDKGKRFDYHYETR